MTSKQTTQVLERLRQGNAMYVAQGGPWRTRFDRDKAQTADPVAAIIVCSDITFFPEQVLGLSPGELYVMQTAANFVGNTEAAGAEFAHHIDGVELVVVLGHSPCNALQAMSVDAPGSGNELVQTESCADNTRAHASQMASTLREKLTSKSTICIVPAHLDEATGEIEFL